MKNPNRKLLGMGFLVFVVGAFMPAHSFAGVAVFAEGAYTETDLDVYIYANTNIDGGTVLRSAGVKLIYSPSELTVVSAEKNEDEWYMGAGAQDPDKEYMNPITEIVGEVVIILGKLDTDYPDVGVSGDRVLLGKVSFAREGSSMPFSPTLGLTFAHGTGDPTDSFKNFVDTQVPANVLDDDDPASITFGSIDDPPPPNEGIKVRERGDAEADGDIDVFDLMELRNLITNGGFSHWADCEGDEDIDVFDMLCIRNKI